MTNQEILDELIKRRRVIEKLGDSTEAMDAAIAALREREAASDIARHLAARLDRCGRCLGLEKSGECPQCGPARLALAKFAEQRKGEPKS